MPRSPVTAGSAADWLRRARSNLTRAEQPPPDGVVYEDLCFDAQQAAEKSLKALLLDRQIAFRFVHDIGELLFTLNDADIEIPDGVRDAVELTEFAVEARYPGAFEAVTEAEWQRAVKLAREVFIWVETSLNAEE